MNDAPRAAQEPRPFLAAQAPAPFLKSPEGRRIVGFAILLLVVASAGLFWMYRRAEARIEAAAAQRASEAAAARNAPSEAEWLAQKRSQLETAFEGAFRDTTNDDDFIETAGYHKLIELLASSTPEEVTRRCTTYLDHAKALREPDLLRGDYVRVRGLLGGLFAVKLERPEHDVTDVWRGSISQPDGESEAVIFDLIGVPPQLEKRRTVVEIDGLVYRRVAYEAKDGTQRKAPYVLARNLRAIEEAPASGGGRKYLAIAAGLGLIAGWLILRSSLRSKRTPVRAARIKDLFEQRRHAARPPERH